MKLLVINLVFFFLAFASLPQISSAFSIRNRVSQKIIIGEEDLKSWETGLLHLAPASEPAYAPHAKFPLVLAAKRTNRPDILRRFRQYRDGWDITNRHYWASVGFTGAAGFILASLWFVAFGFVLAVHRCCRWGIRLKKKSTFCSHRICLSLLLVFTCAAAIGCILLSVGQDEFHSKVLHTLSFVVNQSDFTVEILMNVTEFLSVAKTINVGQILLPSDVKSKIDRLNVDLNTAANTLTAKTSENSVKIRKALNSVRYALIVVAAVMLVLTLLGLLLSILGYQHAIYIAIADTCTAMEEYVAYPQAETALSNILPCADERMTNQTLYQSKEVIHQLVNVVNTAIYTIANSNPPPEATLYYYNQSGPLIPPLCCPLDGQLRNRQCRPEEVSFANASIVWQNYTCKVSDSGQCVNPGRITPEIYTQLVLAVNVSYALDHYTPLLLSLQDCRFVRETFTSVTTLYCPNLERYLEMVITGLALISIGVMLCLVLWILYANRPRREEVFGRLSVVNVAGSKEAESC
ncbi:uncharacterized protein LOC143855024 isoform X2 [Tasmannia lanceolata]|uniref:uncharacterized protein LOC143855024 isoform X2 n=1 Tax=Tasmannia lanceolata TaxID=3420 RepID=UPI00406304DA